MAPPQGGSHRAVDLWNKQRFLDWRVDEHIYKWVECEAWKVELGVQAGELVLQPAE